MPPFIACSVLRNVTQRHISGLFPQVIGGQHRVWPWLMMEGWVRSSPDCRSLRGALKHAPCTQISSPLFLPPTPSYKWDCTSSPIPIKQRQSLWESDKIKGSWRWQKDCAFSYIWPSQCLPSKAPEVYLKPVGLGTHSFQDCPCAPAVLTVCAWPSWAVWRLAVIYLGCCWSKTFSSSLYLKHFAFVLVLYHLGSWKVRKVETQLNYFIFYWKKEILETNCNNRNF